MKAPMVDKGIERAWVAALIADPSRHDSSTVSLQELGDPHARAAFEAFANVRARAARFRRRGPFAPSSNAPTS